MRGAKKPISPPPEFLFDLGPHVIDQALVLFGEPQSITAVSFLRARTRRWMIRLTFAWSIPDLRAMGRARIIAYAPGPHFLIHGTNGSFVKYGMDPQEARLRGDRLSARHGLGCRLGSRTGRVVGNA